MKLGEIKGKFFGTISKPGKDLLEAVYKNRNILDDFFLLLSLPRPWNHKRRLYQQLRRQTKLANQGALEGYPFQDFQFRVLNPQLAPTLYREIFLAESYFFQTDKERPLIIDGGVNIGVSAAYFKWLYPNSRIIGFEPHPMVYDVAKFNIEFNRMTDVELINAALASIKGKAQLHTIPQKDKSSTLTNRLDVRGFEVESILVDTLPLSEFITSEIDFLKLDIEGAEQSVLQDIEGSLELVNKMFIEFHHTHGDSSNRLSILTDILERHGFWYLITSPVETRRYAAVTPIEGVRPIFTISIFAKKPVL